MLFIMLKWVNLVLNGESWQESLGTKTSADASILMFSALQSSNSFEAKMGASYKQIIFNSQFN